jgi:hypothetical protein
VSVVPAIVRHNCPRAGVEASGSTTRNIAVALPTQIVEPQIGLAARRVETRCPIVKPVPGSRSVSRAEIWPAVTVEGKEAWVIVGVQEELAGVIVPVEVAWAIAEEPAVQAIVAGLVVVVRTV